MRDYDGSIRINTEVDSTGFSKGTQSMSAGVARVGVSMKALGAVINKVVSGAVAGMLVLGSAIAVAATTIAFIIGRMMELGKNLLEAMRDSAAYSEQVNRLTESFNGLKGALAAAFAPLLAAALPVIIQIINWLTTLINTIGMVIAALSGQKTYMVATATAADAAAGGAGKLAKNTEKAAKAAKGYLASFDQINVLQKDEAQPTAPDAATGGGGAAGGAFKWTELPIPDDILRLGDVIEWLKDKWQLMKLAAVLAWEVVKAKAAEAWAWVGEKAKEGALWVLRAYENMEAWTLQASENIKLWIAGAWEWIKTKWGEAGAWFQGILDDVKARFVAVWEAIKTDVATAWLRVQLIWGAAKIWFQTKVIDPVREGFKEALEKVKTFFSTAWLGIQLVWSLAKQWFTSKVTDPIKEAFKKALDWVGEKFTSVFDGIKTTVRGVVNVVITILNKLLNGMASAVNGMIDMINSMQVNVPNWVPVIGGQSYSFALPRVTAPNIPYLAQGAVVPANAPFAAILGDQRNGRNLEAPEGLIRQIMREEMASMGGGNITVTFGGTMGELIRVLRPEINYENRRRGNNLIAGTA